MKIVTVYTPGALRDETEEALLLHWAGRGTWVPVEIAVNDPLAYGQIIAELWAAGESFAVVEPDVLVRDDVIDGFLNCPEPYCAWPYAWLTDVGPALGCTRFRAEFLARYPDAMKEVLSTNVSWRQLDVVLMRHVLVREYGEQPHVHLPPVVHLNEAKALLPEANPEPLMSLPAW